MTVRFTLILAVALAFGASNVSAASDGTVVGSGTTAWGEAFTLRVTDQKTPYGTFRCLGYEDSHGGGSGCPLEKPATDRVDVQTDANCVDKHVALFGALNPQVARVQVRLIGGKTLTAQRFDPNPQVDPGIAYWIATYSSLTQVRSITTVAADGTVLARNHESAGNICQDDHHPFRGRRWTVGRAIDAQHAALRLDAYRRMIERRGRLVPGLCLGLAARPPGETHSESRGEACGVGFERGAKALELIGNDEGCGASRMLYAYGAARSKVARIVIRSSAGWTVVRPQIAPSWLRAPGKLWFAAVHWPAKGVVIDAQDSQGRSIAKDRVKPFKSPLARDCSASSFGGISGAI